MTTSNTAEIEVDGIKITLITPEEIKAHQARKNFVDIVMYARMVPEKNEIGSIVKRIPRGDQTGGILVFDLIPLERIFIVEPEMKGRA